MCQILDDNYYNEKYLIQTRSQAKTSGIKLLEVHGMGKNSEKKQEQQHAISKQGMCGKAIYRLDQEERELTPSINQLINHQTCHRKFLEEQK